jgi:hypothetical protein
VESFRIFSGKLTQEKTDWRPAEEVTEELKADA